MTERDVTCGTDAQPGEVAGAALGSSSLVPLYGGFVASGIGVALPGAILPVLLMRWKLQDEGGGTLFLLAFAGSSLGALLVSGSLLRAVAFGSIVIALASVGLSVCPAGLAFSFMFLSGLGLGGTMTAMSLLVQRRTQGASQAMVRVNLMWALGASLCPVLALQTLRKAEPGALLYPLAGAFVLLALWALGQARESVQEENQPKADFLERFRERGSLVSFFRAVPLSTILLVMLATGVEAAGGGWLATYAKREGDPFLGMVAAPTCLWAGLLLSRFVWSVAPRVKERLVIQGSLATMAVAAVGLLSVRHGWGFFFAALCLGFGAGPIYPLLLAKALRFHASGMIFFLAGVGSAIVPWLMGFVSTHSRSLHTGFYVPAIGCVAMLLLSVLNPAERDKGRIYR